MNIALLISFLISCANPAERNPFPFEAGNLIIKARHELEFNVEEKLAMCGGETLSSGHRAYKVESIHGEWVQWKIPHHHNSDKGFEDLFYWTNIRDLANVVIFVCQQSFSHIR